VVCEKCATGTDVQLTLTACQWTCQPAGILDRFDWGGNVDCAIMDRSLSE
jgi:hypothetical protein